MCAIFDLFINSLIVFIHILTATHLSGHFVENSDFKRKGILDFIE